MIGYPNGKTVKQTTTLKDSFSNRGMTLEHDINVSNDYYLQLDKAVIHKKPTPVQIVAVDYPKRSAAKISEAYFKIPSTTDYNGVYRGRAIDFEAKECKNKTSFPFQVIHPHQIEHLKRVEKHGAIAFIIIRFSYYNETYFVEASKIVTRYNESKVRSLPYSWFQEEAYLIAFSLTPPVNYLKIVDELYFKGEK